MMSASLTALAQSFAQAARQMPRRADEVVHTVAHSIESEVRAIDGTPENVVTTFPGDGHAHLGGLAQDGTYQEDQGAAGLGQLSMSDTADQMSSLLLDEGSGLITKGKRR